MLEDDVRLQRSWRKWVQAAQGVGRTVVGYASYPKLYPQWFRDAEEAGEPVTPGLYGLKNPPGFWGAQCVWFPRHALNELWADPRLHSLEADGVPIDTFLAKHWTQASRHAQPLLAIPNFCEHVAPPSVLRPRRPHKSYSFGHPVKGGDAWPAPMT